MLSSSNSVTVLMRISLLGFLLVACNTPQPAERPTLKTVGPGEGRLDIVAWEGYVEGGGNDKRFDWVTDFEKETGCKVNVEYAATSDEMVSLMNQGGYDLVTAPGDAAIRLINTGKVQPINIGLIPSWSKVDSRLQDAPWHTVNGVHYGVPFQWMPNVLMYNTDVFPNPPSSWDVIYKEQTLPDGNSNSGRIEAYEGPISIADAALYLMNTRPELGIVDPYELDREQFGAVINLLRNQRRLVSDYWHTASGQIEDFRYGDNVASASWPYQSRMLQLAGRPIADVIPSGGSTGRADSLMLHSDALHPNCAYLWMEHSLDAKVQGDIAAWAGTDPSVPAACQASALLGPSGCKSNGYDNFDHIYFWKTPVADCGHTGDQCVPYSDWVTSYIAVIGGQ